MGDVNRLSPRNAETMARYYGRANVGDFMGAVACLSPDVTFQVSGNRALLPFAGTWTGRDAVLRLFQAFGAAFRIVDMSETRTISSSDQVFSFNDEAFKVNSTGIFYRVPVVHHVRFADGLMTSLHNIHDTYAAEQAFAGADAITLPLVNSTLLPGEERVSDATAEATVRAFLEHLTRGTSPGDLLADDVRVLAPGARSRVPFGGVWLGKAESLTFFDRWHAVLERQTMRINEVVALHGAVAVSVVDTVEVRASGRRMETSWIGLVQINGDGHIGRVSLYLDTPAFGAAWQPSATLRARADVRMESSLERVQP